MAILITIKLYVKTGLAPPLTLVSPIGKIIVVTFGFEKAKPDFLEYVMISGFRIGADKFRFDRGAFPKASR